MLIVRQSTARAVLVGPVLDASGVAVTDGVIGDLKISKNGVVPVALNGSATLTHRFSGFYLLTFTTSDLDTVGVTEIVIDDTVNTMPIKELIVIEEAVYDMSFASGSTGLSPADSFVTDAIADSIPADGSRPTPAQALYLITQFLLERTVAGTTVTVKKVDGSTTLFTLTINDSTTPTSITRAT